MDKVKMLLPGISQRELCVQKWNNRKTPQKRKYL